MAVRVNWAAFEGTYLNAGQLVSLPMPIALSLSH